MNPSTNKIRSLLVLPPSRLKRWLAAISAVLLTTLGASAVAPAAQAAPKEASATVFSVPGWDYANVRSGPSTDKPTVKTIPAGTTVTLGCSTRGGNATGPYGSSDLWYKVAGTDTYVADVMILTGSDDAVTEACGETKKKEKAEPPEAPQRDYIANDGKVALNLYNHYYLGNGRSVQIEWDYFSNNNIFVDRVKNGNIPIGKTAQYETLNYGGGIDMYLALRNFSIKRTSESCYTIFDWYDFEWKDYPIQRAHEELKWAKPYSVHSSGCL